MLHNRMFPHDYIRLNTLALQGMGWPKLSFRDCIQCEVSTSLTFQENVSDRPKLLIVYLWLSIRFIPASAELQV